MPRDLGIPNQSQSNNQENEKPSSDSVNNPTSGSPSKDDDEEFVDIDHEDVDMQESQTGKGDDLGLHTFGNNIRDVDEDEDSEEEHDQMASHPLLSMLSGRMGQRRRGSTHKWDVLHPVTQVLSPGNVGDCTTLENSAFPENERCSREKVCKDLI